MSENLTIEQAVGAYLGDTELNTGNDEANIPDGGQGPEPLERGDFEDEISEEDSDLQDGDETAPQDETSEDDDVDDGEEAPAEEQTSIEAPEYWKPEAKAEWEKLPDNLKAVLAEQDQHVRSLVGTKVAEATQAAQAANNERQTYRQQAEKLEAEIERAAMYITSKYEGIDLNNLRKSNPHAYVQVIEEMDRDKAVIQHYQNVKAETDVLNRKAFLTEEFGVLAQLAATHPIARDLNDQSIKGDNLRGRLSEYLVNNGVAPDRHSLIGARELIMATQSMLYEQSQKAAASKIGKTSQKPNQTQGKVRAPTASTQSSTSMEVKKAEARLAKSGSIDDAVNAYMARNRNRR